MPSSFLITGGTGQLGAALAASAGHGSARSVSYSAPGSAELDLTDAAGTHARVRRFAEKARAAGANPVVINAAAYTAVDAAESEVQRAQAINADGPAALAAASEENDVGLIHVSTDYVFAGDRDRLARDAPYQPEDECDPRSVYGRTKLAGERAVLTAGARAWVVRTAWLYGELGGNFVRTMTRLENERETVSVVDDQFGSPTSAADLANGLIELAIRVADGDGPGQRVLHCVNGGSASWFEFARAIFVELGADPNRVIPCDSTEFARPAPRPAYSVLSTRAWREAGLTPLRHWREALTACGIRRWTR